MPAPKQPDSLLMSSTLRLGYKPTCVMCRRGNSKGPVSENVAKVLQNMTGSDLVDHSEHQTTSTRLDDLSEKLNLGFENLRTGIMSDVNAALGKAVQC